jgi:acylphosphatase
MARSAVRLSITGRVQGVGYRWWAVNKAKALGLEGWVRNRADGSVELLAIGHPEALSALASACAAGPSGVGVREVRRLPAQDDGSQGFTQKATA